MMEFKTKRYIDQLQSIVDGLNNRFLPAIGTAPASVTVQNQLAIFHKRYDHIFRHKLGTPKYRVGDFCRLHLQKRNVAFDKSYMPNFGDEIYRISAIRKAPPVHMYELTDLNGNRISGRWYQQSLTPVYESEEINQ